MRKLLSYMKKSLMYVLSIKFVLSNVEEGDYKY